MIHSYNSQFNTSKPARMIHAQAPQAMPQQAMQNPDGTPMEEAKPKTVINQVADWVGEKILEGTRGGIRFLMSDSNPAMRILRYHRFPQHEVPFKNFWSSKFNAAKSIGGGIGNTALASASFANQVASTGLDFVDAPWNVPANLNARTQLIVSQPKEFLEKATTGFRQGFKELFGLN